MSAKNVKIRDKKSNKLNYKVSFLKNSWMKF